MAKDMKTIDIKGKDYVLVNERIKAFRSSPEFKNWSIENIFIELSNERCVIRSEIRNDKGELKATGYAYEVQSSSYINKTSYIENCETSAVGRALGFMGIGVDTSICSAEELVIALENQKGGDKDTSTTTKTKKANTTPKPKEEPAPQPSEESKPPLTDLNKKILQEIIQRGIEAKGGTEDSWKACIAKKLGKTFDAIVDADVNNAVSIVNQFINVEAAV